MDLKEIQNLIKFVAKSGASEVKLEMDDVKITIRTGNEADTKQVQQLTVPVPMPATPVAPATVAAPAPAEPSKAEAAQGDDKYITIKSPIIGTFYRRPSPDKPIFAEVGQTIAEGDVLCIIEAMKLFNEIESEISGKIIKVLVDDSTPIEFDQPLFLIDPA